jgi:hypothetical protein
VLDGHTWACDPNGPSFTAMPFSARKNTVVVKDEATNKYFVISPNDRTMVPLPSLSDDNEIHQELAQIAAVSHAKQDPNVDPFDFDPVATMTRIYCNCYQDDKGNHNLQVGRPFSARNGFGPISVSLPGADAEKMRKTKELR